jgi:hypothetical protein
MSDKVSDLPEEPVPTAAEVQALRAFFATRRDGFAEDTGTAEAVTRAMIARKRAAWGVSGRDG